MKNNSGFIESKESASRLDIFEYGPLQKLEKLVLEEFFVSRMGGGYFSFRPGIKRLYDYNLIGGYNKFKNELDIGVEYKKRGYYTVIIEKPAVVDIGDDYHVGDVTRKG